jgi:hypothetical protein
MGRNFSPSHVIAGRGPPQKKGSGHYAIERGLHIVDVGGVTGRKVSLDLHSSWAIV